MWHESRSRDHSEIIRRKELLLFIGEAERDRNVLLRGLQRMGFLSPLPWVISFCMSHWIYVCLDSHWKGSRFSQWISIFTGINNCHFPVYGGFQAQAMALLWGDRIFRMCSLMEKKFVIEDLLKGAPGILDLSLFSLCYWVVMRTTQSSPSNFASSCNLIPIFCFIICSKVTGTKDSWAENSKTMKQIKSFLLCW